MAVADVTEKNLKAVEDQTSAIESLVEITEKEIVMTNAHQKAAHESLAKTEKYQNASRIERKAMVEHQKSNILMLQRSDAREEKEKTARLKAETAKKINDEIQLSAFEELSTIGKFAVNTQKSSGLFLQRLVGLETRKQREDREARKEAARNKDRGAMGSMLLGREKDKKGGLFGLLAKLFTGSSKLIGPILNFAKFFLKIGGLAILIAGAIAGAIFFNKSEKEQKEMIDNVVSFFNKIGTVLKKLGDAFGGAFMDNMKDTEDTEGNPIEGLVTKFGKFKDAWKKVLDTVSNIKIGEYVGLEGIAKFFGDTFSKLLGWLMDVGTGIAELITNPTETLAKLQVKIESFFMGIADMLGRVFDKFFNMEFILSMLPQEFVPDALQESVSKSRLKEKQKRIKQLNQDDKNTQALLDSAEKDLKAEQALEGGGNKVNLRNLTLAIERSKMQLEANKEQKEYLKEQMLASRKNVIQERLNQRIKQITGIDNQDALEEIKKQEELANKFREKEVHGLGSSDFRDMSLTNFKSLQKKLEAATGVAVGEGKLDRSTNIRYADTGITTEFIKSKVGQDLLNEFKKQGLVDMDFGEAGEEKNAIKQFEILLGKGIQNQIVITRAQTKATTLQKKLDDEKEAKLAAVGGEAALLAEVTSQVLAEVVEGSKQTGGPIHQTGLYKLHGGELVMDNAAVNLLAQTTTVASGMNLMNLQRDSSAGTIQGNSTPIVISNAPTTQINQSQAMILPPSPIQPGNSEAPRLLN
jgi:hypothetical protein